MRGGFKGHMKTSESLGRPQKGLGGQESMDEWMGKKFPYEAAALHKIIENYHR